MNANTLTYHIYTYRETKTISLANIEIWQKAPPDALPTNFVYREELDFVELLLSKGLARLRNETLGPEKWRAAQRAARETKQGIWWVPPPAPNTTTTGSPPSIVTDASTTSQTDPVSRRTGPDSGKQTLASIARTALAWLGVLFGLIGLKDLIVVLWSWFTRHRIYLVMIGEPSVGKTWTWARLNDPAISVAKLREIQRTIGVHRAQMPQRMPFGRYELVPVFLDVGGDEPGAQFDLLTDRRRLRFLQRLVVPQKRIWIVHVSTTPRTNVQFSSPTAEKIDDAHIEQELGALRMVEGVLASKNAPKPEAVVLSIAKIDIFADHDPNSDENVPGVKEAVRLFERHIVRIKTECEHRGIPFHVILTSALRNWGTQNLMNVVNELYYPVRKVRS